MGNTLPPAPALLLTARDWDYARATYRRLNEQLTHVRPYLPARDELRVQDWQVEFTGLQASSLAHALPAATKKQVSLLANWNSLFAPGSFCPATREPQPTR